LCPYNEGGREVLEPLLLKSKPKRNSLPPGVPETSDNVKRVLYINTQLSTNSSTKSADNTNHADDRNKIRSAGSNLQSRKQYPHL